MPTLNIVVQTGEKESTTGVSFLQEEARALFASLHQELEQWLKDMGIDGDVRQHQSGVVPLFYADVSDEQLKAVMSAERPDFVRALTDNQIPITVQTFASDA